MNLHCLLLTTSKEHWMSDDVEMVRQWLMKTKGRDSVTFDVKTVRSFASVPTVLDAEGHRRLQWEWFEKQFVKNLDPKYNAVGFHFSRAERRKWGMTPKIAGTYNRNRDNTLDFWVCADKGEKSKHYPYSNFARILVHEILHGDVHWTNRERGLVHLWDYDYQDIHSLPELLSYRDWNILMKIKNLLSGFLDKYAKTGDSQANTLK